MHSYLPLEWIHSNLEWIHSNREWIHSKSLDVFLEKCSGPAQNNIIWKILFGMDSTKIFRVLATTFGSQILKKLFNPSMNSFQYGMNVFQVRMNSFHMGMYSYYYRYSHTVIWLKKEMFLINFLLFLVILAQEGKEEQQGAP